MEDSKPILEDLPILFVDDEPEVLKALERSVERCGWSSDTAHGPRLGLEKLSEREYSVVVSDFRMPTMDGVQFLAEVRRHWGLAERVLLTAYADAEALERGINEAGIARFLRKPWQREVLLATLKQARAQNRVRREHSLLLERVRNRNEELSYLNRLLRDSVEESARAIVRFRRRWDVALSAIPDAILIVDDDYRVEGANEAAAALAGESFDDIESRKCYEVLFNKSKPCDDCPIESGESNFREGQHVYEARAYRLPGSQASHLCIYRDVTSEVAFRAEAAHFEKMAAIGRLSGGLAHELNNPLHGILSFVQLAQKPKVNPEKLERYHEVIRECALRCRDIILSLRDFARKPAVGERGETDLNIVCEKALVLFENIGARPVDACLSPTPATCRGNANQLQQVIVNLLQNAIDASPETGRVSLTVERDNDEMIVAVEDSGSGISLEDRERIFEPFYTTKPEGKGTGLGLAISHTIVQDHGGSLRATESGHGGARFEMRLPALVPPRHVQETETLHGS